MILVGVSRKLWTYEVDRCRKLSFLTRYLSQGHLNIADFSSKPPHWNQNRATSARTVHWIGSYHNQVECGEFTREISSDGVYQVPRHQATSTKVSIADRRDGVCLLSLALLRARICRKRLLFLPASERFVGSTARYTKTPFFVAYLPSTPFLRFRTLKESFRKWTRPQKCRLSL